MVIKENEKTTYFYGYVDTKNTHCVDISCMKLPKIGSKLPKIKLSLPTIDFILV